MPRMKIPMPDNMRGANFLFARYGICHATLWHWLRKPELAFPRPVYVGNTRFWKLEDIEAWDASRQAPARSAA